MINKKKLSEMSGENESGGAPKLVLNQIRFNGKKGVYVYEDVKGGLIEDSSTGKKSYAKKNLGNDIDVVFLKIRRRLYQFRKDEKPRVTNEHNHSGARVVLFGDKIENGIASELREKYPQLRTQQIVYGLYQGELIRLVVKGASLGSKAKAKGVDDFYTYLAKYKGEDHFYENTTNLTVGEEAGELGEYYVMNFAKGRKLTETEIEEAVTPNMETAFNFCQESDHYYLSRMPKELEKEHKETPAVAEYVDVDEIPEGDIPF